MSELNRKSKLAKLNIFMNHVPFMVQFMTITVLTTTVIISILIFNNYASIRQQAIGNQVSLSTELLQMESENLDQYLSELANFCILPFYDSEFTRIINQKSPLSEAQKSYIKKQMYYYYYTRNDLLEYEIYLINQKEAYGRTSSQQHMIVQDFPSFNTKVAMEKCENSPLHHFIEPAGDSAFFTYYHSLFQVKGKKQQSIVKLQINNAYLKRLLSGHDFKNEILLLLNENDELVYSSETDLAVALEDISTFIETKATHHGNYESIKINAKKYLLIEALSENGIKLYHLIPVSKIDKQFKGTALRVIVLGIIIWIITIFLLYLLSRLLTAPLKTLANQMHETGQGDFDTLLHEGGSKEVSELVTSYNSMVSEIDQLIRRTYVAELSEKNAQLIALEAQINPHFLYNTLQAISTEALVNDQSQIYHMVTSLASNLRYTIKDAALVPLSRELQYVDNYILLQKIRMDDALTFTSDIDPNTTKLLIPKISIHTMIENSIIHGLNKETGKIAIHLTTHFDSEQKKLMIKVWDNGCGISKEQLQAMQQEFESKAENEGKSSIGLANLYTRLQLLYDSPGILQINSEENQYTEVILTLPAIKENTNV